MSESLRIIFAGTPEFTLPGLNALYTSRHNLQAVYTQPDRPAGRGRKLQPSAVKNWALAHSVPIYQPVNFKDPASVEQLAALQPDVMVVIAYGLILPKKILTIPRLGCINVHASLLPRWRGASPIQQSVWQGDKESGVTIMQMDVGMDTGDILATVSCPLEPDETSGSLHDKLAELAVEPLLQTLDALASGQSKAQPQNPDGVTYAAKINKEDAKINWQLSAKAIDCQIRACNPWPVAFTMAGDEMMRIHQARVVDTQVDALPGTVLALDKSGLLVATGEQAILAERVQFAGGKMMSVADWLNARRDTLFVSQVLQ